MKFLALTATLSCMLLSGCGRTVSETYTPNEDGSITVTDKVSGKERVVGERGRETATPNRGSSGRGSAGE